MVPFRVILLSCLLSAVAGGPSANARELSVADLFEGPLITTSGAPVSKESLRGKIVALFFAAHWCQGSRGFGPALARFRNDNAARDFEIVLISLDNSDAEKERFIRDSGIKALTVPGARSPEAVALARRFEVRKLPRLVILSPDGAVLSADGRSEIATRPKDAVQRWIALASSR